MESERRYEKNSEAQVTSLVAWLGPNIFTSINRQMLVHLSSLCEIVLLVNRLARNRLVVKFTLNVSMQKIEKKSLK